MSESAAGIRSHITLALCALLHSFTHAYGTLLVPLYLLMVNDLHLGGVKGASLIVTIYGLVYCMGSFFAGVLADRINRKALLGIGLIGNAAAMIGMGLTRQYELLIAFGVIGGVFGTFFHPAANALVPAHYPKSPGMAIGLLGVGSGLGFFLGPQYAGWRAQSASWTFAQVAGWQRPLVEAGIVGVIFGILFLLIAKETARPARVARELARGPTGRALAKRVAAVACVLGWRDFSGVAVFSLGSVYLQKAHGLDAKQTGFILGAMMLISMIINPIAVWLSPGKRRLPVLACTLVGGAIVLATVPYWSIRSVLPVLCIYQAFQLGSYAVGDAGMLERVSPHVRGRVVGVYLSLAGTASSSAPFFMGWWTDALKDRANQAHAYYPIFGVLAGMMAIAAFSTPLIARLGSVESSIDPLSETTPLTAEPAL